MLDIEQIVLRRRLVLGVLVTAPARLEDAARRRSSEAAADLDMRSSVDRGTGDNRAAPRGPQPRHGARHAAQGRGDVAAIAGRIADTGANIDRIERMARYPVTAIDLHVSGADPDRLRAVARRARRPRQGVDVAVQPANLLRRGMRLIVMDVDSTLIQGEVIEMLAAHAGCERRGRARSPRRRCAASSTSRSRCASGSRCSRGSTRRRLDEVYDDDRARPRRPHAGAHAASGSATGSRSSPAASPRSPTGSPPTSASTSPRANELEIVDGRLTGRIVGDVVDRAGKAAALRAVRRRGRRPRRPP